LFISYNLIISRIDWKGECTRHLCLLLVLLVIRARQTDIVSILELLLSVFFWHGDILLLKSGVLLGGA
jgi:hypothetical protein